VTNFDVSIRANFVNRMGDGTKRAKADIEGVGRAAKNLDRANFAARMSGQFLHVTDAARRLRAAIQNIDVERIGKVAAGVTAAVATMKRTLAAPAMADADFGDVVIDIAQKAEIAKDKIGGLADEIKGMADRLRSSPLSIGKGIDVLMGSGLDLDVSKRLVGPIQKVAKAYRVETDEVSKAVFSMVNNLKVAPEDVEVALGRIAQAAADGRYEVKDFAAGLPELASTLQKFNQTGLKGVSRGAALLETVAGRAGVPGQATSWSEQMLDKALSPDVVKNFKKKGIKIDSLIRAAMKSGEDVNEVIYAAMMKATKGDATKLIDIYGDEQARNAAAALMLDIKKYRELRDKYDKITSPDKLNSDLDMRVEGSGAKFRTFGERWLAFQETVGKGVNIYLAPAVEMMGKMLDVVTRLFEQFPKLTGAVTLFGASLAAFAAAKTAAGVIGGLAARLGVGGASAGAGVGAGGAAAAGAGAGGAAAAATRAGFVTRAMPLVGRAGAAGLGIALGYAVTQAIEALKARSWTVKDRDEGVGRLKDLRARLAELDGRIAGIEAKSKAPEMAASLTLPLKLEKAQIEAEIAAIEAELKRLGETRATPQIDTSSIERALELTRMLKGELQGVAAPSLLRNVAPAGSSAVRGSAGGSGSPATGGGSSGASPGKQSTLGGPSTTVHQHIRGADPRAIARASQREQDRAVRRAVAGSLHDLGGSWA
jgi:hypothetical protein